MSALTASGISDLGWASTVLVMPVWFPAMSGFDFKVYIAANHITYIYISLITSTVYVSDNGLEEPNLFPEGSKDFLSDLSMQTRFSVNQPFIQWVPQSFPGGLNAAGARHWSLTPSTAKLRDECRSNRKKAKAKHQWSVIFNKRIYFYCQKWMTCIFILFATSKTRDRCRSRFLLCCVQTSITTKLRFWCYVRLK